jgi:radical SAM protein with 4Fe4S-binding SPASM domain
MHREIRRLSDEAMAEMSAKMLADPDQADKKPKTLKVMLSDEGIQAKIKAYIKDQLMGVYNSGIEPCSATTGLYIFDPFWKIYTCWDSVGIPGHETGVYGAEGAALNQMNANWLNRSPATIEECKDCKYAFFHFGGCASLPVGTKGTIFGPACYEFQDNFIYVGQGFFKQGIEKIIAQPTVPAGIQEATSGVQAGLGGD